MGAWALAIDFGSVSTVAGTVQAEGSELLAFDGQLRLPSVVCLREGSGELEAGFTAERLSLAAPWRAQRTPKCRIADEWLSLGETRVATTDAIAVVLRRAAEEAIARHEGEEPSGTWLAHPSDWDGAARDKLCGAAEVAGLGSPHLVPVPVAVAAACAGEQVASGDLVAICYLGAASFEACVLRRSDTSFEVLVEPRTVSLGGEDFDGRLCRFVAEQLEETERRNLFSEDDHGPWQVAAYALRKNVRLAKEQLSDNAHTTVVVPDPVGREVRISRSDLEGLIADDIRASVEQLQATVQAAGLAPGQLDGVYLAGGSTRLPLVSLMIEQILGVRPTASPDPTCVVAIGTAALAKRPATHAAAAPSAPSAEQPSDELHQVEFDDDVQFTVFRPHSVQPGRWYALLAFAHKTEPFVDEAVGPVDPIQEVSRQAVTRLGEDFSSYGQSSDDSAQELPRGSDLTFVPEIEGVEFNPPSRSFRWLEPVHQEEFRMRASPSLDRKRARGRLSVFLGSIVIAEVSLSFRVSSGEKRPDMGREQSRPYRKIFISYSHRDVAVVEQVEQFLSIVGDEFLRDARDLRAGELWEERLAEMIREADIFQLFWSRNSMTSRFVREEWSYALSLGRPYFVRPTFWEQPMPELPDENLPPDELRRLHFRYLPALLASSREEAPAAAAGGLAAPPAGTPEEPHGPERPGAPEEPPGAPESGRPPKPKPRGTFITRNPALATVFAALVIAVPVALASTGVFSHGSSSSAVPSATSAPSEPSPGASGAPAPGAIAPAPSSFTLSAQGSVSDGVAVNPVMNTTRSIGLVVFTLTPARAEVGTVFLGTFSGQPSIHWNLKVGGNTLGPGSYEIDLRVFANGNPTNVPGPPPRYLEISGNQVSVS